MSQAGFQMFRSSMSATAAPEPAPAPTNVFYSATPAPSVTSSSSTVVAAASTNPAAKNEIIAFFSQQSKENLEITASVINHLNAFFAG
ncbi:hypothetical protein Hanom_Chr06g00537801 [Helianthus anomalus]